MREFTGSEIKEIRFLLGENGRPMSQKDFGRLFSEKFPVTNVTISRWETNFHKPKPVYRARLEQLWTVVETKRRRPPPKPNEESFGDGLILNLRFDR